MTLLSEKRTRATSRPTGQGRQIAAVVAPVTGNAGRTMLLPATHRRTGYVFEALLGVAACLSLIAVIHTSRATDTSAPDAPPPAVFVQTD